MVLGALLDLGLPLDALKGALGSLALEYGDISAERVSRAGVSATKFRLHDTPPRRATGRRSPISHYHLKGIVNAIRRSALKPESQERAVHLFERLAEAEAAIHDTPIEKVHLHEVGALDSIIDIVGAVYGFDWLRHRRHRVVAAERRRRHGALRARRLPGAGAGDGAAAEGRAGVRQRHVGAGDADGRAARHRLRAGVRAAAGRCSIEQIGYGAGDRDPKGTPNVLRILNGRARAGRRTRRRARRVVKIECEIDDMNPQLFGPLMDSAARPPARWTCSTRRCR